MGAAVAQHVGTLVAYPLNRFFLPKRIETSKDAPYLKPLFYLLPGEYWSTLLTGIVSHEGALLIVFLAASAILSIIH